MRFATVALTVAFSFLNAARAQSNGTTYSDESKSNNGDTLSVFGGVLLNNQWGSSSANSGWYQVITKHDDGTASTNYNWWGNDGQVKAYPAVIFGWHWGWMTSYGEYGLPYQVSSQKKLDVKISTEHTNYADYENMNLSWDIWLSYKASPSNEYDLKTEVMIWPWHKNQYPIGSRDKSDLAFWGTTWTLWKGTMSSNGASWDVYSFVNNADALSISGDIGEFITYLLNLQYISGSEYVCGVEFGNEFLQGKGIFNIQSYSFSGAY